MVNTNRKTHFDERIWLHSLLLLLFLFGIVNLGHSQYHLSLGSSYVYAFGERSIDFQNETFNVNTTQGFEITANNTYQFPNTQIEGILEVGFRQLYFSGSSNSLTYKGQLNKLVSALGVRYVFSERWAASGYIEAENNLELKDFNIGDGDLFRVCLSVESNYSLTDRLILNVLLSRAMTPITEAYIIYNPQYQLRLGIAYRLTK